MVAVYFSTIRRSIYLDFKRGVICFKTVFQIKIISFSVKLLFTKSRQQKQKVKKASSRTKNVEITAQWTFWYCHDITMTLLIYFKWNTWRCQIAISVWHQDLDIRRIRLLMSSWHLHDNGHYQKEILQIVSREVGLFCRHIRKNI